jgi:alanine racemase
MVADRHPEWITRSHVKIDTGMSRLGLQPEQVGEAAAALRKSGKSPATVWTHLAHSSGSSDPRTNSQVNQFRPLVALHGFGDLSTLVLNTGGFVHHPELRSPEAPPVDSWCRIGIGLYGIQSTTSGPAGMLQPVMQLTSRVLQVRPVEAGIGISYDHTWRTSQATRIVTVGAGYADGVPRALSNRGEVGLAGQAGRYPIVGRICMDMFMIDVGHGHDGPAVKQGDEVVVFGDGGPPAVDVARRAETISYELCTGIGPRVRREYVGGV